LNPESRGNACIVCPWIQIALRASGMTKEMERLFSYGTLQQDDVQIATFGRLLATSFDALVGFKQELIEITDPDVLAKSGRRFHPIVVRSGDPADRVEGMLLDITPAELAAADAYEVSDYERVEAQLASGRKAWVYVKRA